MPGRLTQWLHRTRFAPVVLNLVNGTPEGQAKIFLPIWVRKCL